MADDRREAGNAAPREPIAPELPLTHSQLGRTALRLAELEALTQGLVDLLVEKGLLTSEEVGEAAEGLRRQVGIRGDVPEPAVALRMDPPGEQPNSDVDCAARMHVCHAVCCRLDFALSPAEVEAGKVRWDLGRPYYIRHNEDGFCTHNNRETGFCGVYEHRPAVCRGYSCAGDGRIWKDFARMELNVEWLSENLSTKHPRLVAAMMHDIEYRPAYIEYTGAELALIELGVLGARLVFDLLDAPRLATRRHAQRVLEGVVMRLHGWTSEYGYADPRGEGRTASLLRANGSYQANAPEAERRASIERWRAWLDEQEARSPQAQNSREKD
jgi:Fe-S-cluster containining protein